jgi:hypothetical protein
MTSKTEAATDAQMIDEQASFVLAKRASLAESSERIRLAHLAGSSHTTLRTTPIPCTPSSSLTNSYLGFPEDLPNEDRPSPKA